MDVLSEIMHNMQVVGTVYFCDLLDNPWEKAFENTTTTGFHQVRQGGCLFSAEGREEVLQAGDVIFIAQGVDHYLKSLPGSAQQAQEPTLLLCGYFDFQGLVHSTFINSLPRIKVYRGRDRVQYSMVDNLLDQLNQEFCDDTPGSRLLIDKFTEALLIALIRSNFGDEADCQIMRALNDPQIAKALDLLHRRLAKQWTLESLAGDVGMSRAVFARRFKELVGQTMFEYLTEVRMNKAKVLLQTTTALTIDIAAGVGYESDLAFIKTFKKCCGMTPRQYRTQAGPGAVVEPVI